MCVYICIEHTLAMQYRTDTLKPSFFPQEIMKINSDLNARSRLAEVSPEHLKMSINSEGFCSLDLHGFCK